MLADRCERLRSLHVPGQPLVLPNAWDAASARAVVEAGFPVVATSSAAVAEALGYEDDERAPSGEMLAAAARIAASVDVPVTVDAEAGYGMTPEDLVDALLRAGASGCNVEDTDHAIGRLVEPERQAERLAEIRRAADERSYPLVVNARVDVFLADRSGPQTRLVDAAIDRARSYLGAGVDCVYPIFLSEDDALAAFVRAVDAPVNVLASSQAPPLARLAEIGAARVSYGSSIHDRTMRELASLLASLPRS